MRISDWGSDVCYSDLYAKHFETGEPMPQALVDKIKKSMTFNQGYATTEYLSASLLDSAWHTLPADAPSQDVDKFEARSEERLAGQLSVVTCSSRRSQYHIKKNKCPPLHMRDNK